jgi:hypothetical protein
MGPVRLSPQQGVQEAFGRDPNAGDLYVFRGRRAASVRLAAGRPAEDGQDTGSQLRGGGGRGGEAGAGSEAEQAETGE